MFEEDEELFSEAKLEGFYSTWTLFANRLLAVGVNAGAAPVITIDEIGEVYYVAYWDAGGNTRFEIYNLITGVLIGPPIPGAGYLGVIPVHATWQFLPMSQAQGFGQSRNRLIAIVRATLTDVEIYRNGIQLQSINLVPIPFSDPFIFISPSGKWIAMTTWGSQRYLIYRGT